MDIQKEREEFEKLPAVAELIKTNDVWWSDAHGDYFGSDHELDCWIDGAWAVWQAKSQAVPENPWVEFGFPELHKDESSDCLTSKEVFFELLNSGGTYHGWYIARPIDKRDQCCCEEEFEDSDVEYEYFFNANVGDELFDEDHIGRWMYVPNSKEQSHE